METEGRIPSPAAPAPFEENNKLSTDAVSAPLLDKDELKRFYKQDILQLVKTVFFKPVVGIYSLFTTRSEKTYFHSLVLIASAAVVTMVFTFLIMPSALREYMPVFSIMLRAGMATVIFLLLISSTSFGIKMISGKVSFKNELLTGGLCGIPFTAFILVLFVFSKLILDESVFSDLAFGGYGALFEKAGIFLVIVFYILLMFINILQQSLRASGTKDVLLWYLSPAGVVLSLYFTIKILQFF